MTILLVGDVMLGRLVNDALRQKSFAYPWGDTLPIFQKADLRICNLECVITNWPNPWSATLKAFHFRSDTKNMAVLKAAKINAVSLANNHVLDFEYEGLVEILSLLKNAKITYAGAGVNITQAQESAIWLVNKLKIGLIAFTDNQPEWQASAKRPGIFYVPVNLKNKSAQNLFKIIKQIKNQIDFLIVSAHWGGNWGYQPPKEHVSFAHALIDAGADIIYGHSAHVFQGIEIYKRRPILYSCGDFIDDYAVDENERNDQSFIFLIEVGSGKMPIKLKLYPTTIANFQANLAKGQEKMEIARKMQKLCSEFKTETLWQEKEGFLEIT